MTVLPTTIPREHITGLVLAGGQGSRMGGVDKGLQLLGGVPLAQRCAQRLAPQVDTVLINANRNLATYAALGWPVVADLPGLTPADEAFAGPLAGFAAGLAACSTPWLLTVACDTPHFPADLADSMARVAAAQNCLIVMASTPAYGPDAGDKPLPQPAFCLIHTSLAASVRDFVAGGGRKIRQWSQQHPNALALFEDASAFYNANTPEDLAHLQHAPRHESDRNNC